MRSVDFYIGAPYQLSWFFTCVYMWIFKRKHILLSRKYKDTNCSGWHGQKKPLWICILATLVHECANSVVSVMIQIATRWDLSFVHTIEAYLLYLEVKSSFLCCISLNCQCVGRSLICCTEISQTWDVDGKKSGTEMWNLLFLHISKLLKHLEKD